jgi:hypothetical protein
MSGFLKEIVNLQIDPSYAKVWKAYENVFPDVTGNSATFGNGGSLVGQISLSTTASEILIKDKVYKYSSNGSNGQNDYFGFTYTLDNALKDGVRAFGFQLVTENLNTEELSANLKIFGGNSNGLVFENVLVNFTSDKRLETNFYIPSDATSISVGFKNKSTNTAVKVLIDNIYFAYVPFTTVDVLQRQTVYIKEALQAYGGVSGDYLIKFTGTQEHTGSGLFTVDNSGAYTKIVAISECTIDLSAWMRSNISSDALWIEKNEDNVKIILSEVAGGANYPMTINVSLNLLPTEYIVVHAAGFNGLTTNGATLLITAFSNTNNTIVVDNPGMDGWVNSGVTTIGSTGVTAPTKGATSVDKVWWMRDGSDMLIRYEYQQTAAGVAGSNNDYLISIPAGYSVDTSKITPYTTEEGTSYWQPNNQIGSASFAQANGSWIGVPVLYDATRFRIFGWGSSGGSTLATFGYNTASLNLTQAGFAAFIRVPIVGWKNSPRLLALPNSKENVFSAIINADATIESVSSNWITSIVKGGTGVYTVTFKTGIFTVAPAITIGQETGVSIGAPYYASLTATGVQIVTRNSSFAATDLPFTLKAEKQGVDHTAPGVYVGNVSKELVAILKDIKAYNVDGGSAIAGHQVRELNTVEGDIQIVSLVSNRFTLQSGEYEIEASAPVYFSAGMRNFIYIRDISAGTNDAYEGKVQNGYAVDSESRPVLKIKFTLANPKTFELKQYTDNNPATTGLGVAHDAVGYNNTYSIVKIRKLA